MAIQDHLYASPDLDERYGVTESGGDTKSSIHITWFIFLTCLKKEKEVEIQENLRGEWQRTVCGLPAWYINMGPFYDKLHPIQWYTGEKGTRRVQEFEASNWLPDQESMILELVKHKDEKEDFVFDLYMT